MSKSTNIWGWREFGKTTLLLIIIGIIMSAFVLILAGILSQPVRAQEAELYPPPIVTPTLPPPPSEGSVTTSKGQVSIWDADNPARSGSFHLRSVRHKDEIRTTGYIDGRYVRMRSKVEEKEK